MRYLVRRVAAHEWLRLRDLRLEALQEAPAAFVSLYATERMTSDTEWQARARYGSGAAVRPDGRLTATHIIEQVGGRGRWLGMVTAFQEPDALKPQIDLVGVYVAPEQRGRRVGASEALVRGSLAWAFDEAGAQRVRLFVREDNGRALAFYRRLGFTETGGTVPYPPAPSLSELEMEYGGG
ncbi:GNAT family N-acetyltransferase [Streptacidiphilus sp. ASG 303]|uniref:GNAT family N-acetyltransferase n=1 Tax=Streptacidiphilus sp. ASG 303 TaxID=2896847 RepID=UPI001E5B781F|nr:GNAT family N-acetyltransferase [Streptacidiphilus sp. ASG 303]MCD0486254.1 GNAT family N-acetyltransferase [Streptacidiphilus sp. ASG 303]